YEVERVVGHRHTKGKLQYYLKWNGYDSDENTWENKENVFCRDLVEAYWSGVEGVVSNNNNNSNNNGSSSGSSSNDSSWMPPKRWASWEDKVDSILTVERSDQKLLIRLLWSNGKETHHPIEEAHQKCPQKLIQFYEAHIKF
ncbi:chromo-domain-containing protein, partial [Linnemannia elongata AG-77]